MKSFLAIAIACLFATTGCTTLITSKRATPTSKGDQYSLPIPLLLVTPQANGTMTVEVKYIADPNNTYFLRSESLLSNHTLNVVKENGLLKSITFVSKSDEVAAAAIESAGNVAKAIADQDLAQQAAAVAKAEAQASALSDAELAVRIAQATYTALPAEPSEAKVAANVELIKAKAKRDYLLEVAAGGSVDSHSFNVPDEGIQGPVAAAPVLFRVMPDTTGGVKLVAFEGPSFVPTSTAAEVPSKTPAEATVRFKEGSSTVVNRNALEANFVIVVNRKVTEIAAEDSVFKKRGGNGENLQRFILAAVVSKVSADESEITVSLRREIPPGVYEYEPAIVSPSPIGSIQPGPYSPGAVTITVE